MRVLLTGANGLLGHNIILKLVESGHSVVAIVRQSNALRLNYPQLTVVEGNFLDYSTLLCAAQGCDAVIHAAAPTDMSPLKYSFFENVIVKGSQNVIDVCNEVGIKRFVYISTVNTIGYGEEEVPATEKTPMQAPFTQSFYAQAKSEAEKLFVKQSQKVDNHVIILNPAFMLGAYDTKPSSGAMLLAAQGKIVAGCTKGGKNFVHVGDVAQTAVNSLTMGVSGNRYIVGGENLSFRQLYELQKEVSGYPKHIVTLPNVLVKVIGFLGDILRKFSIPVVFSSVNLKQLCVKECYSSQKALCELQMPQTPVRTAVFDSLQWFLAEGKIRRTSKISAK